MSDIFISYARNDRETAKALADALERRGWSVWWDRHIPTGRTFDEVIESQLAETRCVIVLWSKASVASEWVKSEAADAKDRRLLVPVLIEQARIPLEFRRVQAADLTGWTGETTHAGFSTLVSDLTGRLGEPTAPPPHEKPGAGARDVDDDETLREPVQRGRRDAGAAPPPDSGAARRPEPPPKVIDPSDERPTDDRPTDERPTDERPDGVWPKYRVHIIAGAVAVLALAIIGIAVAWSGGRAGANANNRNIAAVNSPSPTPRTGTANTANQTPPPNVNRPNVNGGPTLDRGRRIASLLRQMNSPLERERRGTTGVLKAEFSSDPQAVEQALAMLDESRIGDLSPQGLINVLFFLNNTDDSAWTAETAQKAEAALANIEKRPLGAQATDALGDFKTRVAAAKRAKAKP